MKTFSYSTNGLSYEVTIRADDEGNLFADITVLDGHMDVNAIYWGDDDFSGSSANLGGPLNMNGAGQQFEGERVQWDDALALSRPGLGREGTDKETYLEAGETLEVALPEGLTLDDIDFFGIRATSTSNPEGSIKGVSGNPEEPEDPVDPEDPEVTYDKLFFVTGQGTNDGETFFDQGVVILAEDDGIERDPQFSTVGFLNEGQAGTIQDYIDRFQEIASNPDFELWPDYDDVERIDLYAENAEGELVQVGSIDPPVQSPLPTFAVDEFGDEGLDEDELETADA
ncbi:MAG: hypothetical protein JJU19_02990 [Pararhodobacter sp.]|nr:hypothetical protein [Pararhodobacter sp.]